MIFLQAFVLLLVAAAGTLVVLTRDPVYQAVEFSFFGLLLSVLFLLFQAPDVAFSEIVIGSAAFPLMLLVTIAKIREKSK